MAIEFGLNGKQISVDVDAHTPLLEVLPNDIELSADILENGDVHNGNFDLWSCPHSSRPRGPETVCGMIYA